MTQTEALRLALEALESTGENNGYHGVTQYFDETMVDQAITAIKAALEAKDEPVTENGLYRLGYHNGYGFGEAYGKANAPQRTWVGLTEENKEGLICMTDPNPEPHHLRELIDVVEFQLKEKNT
jgi:hypothetical protein